MNPSQEFRFWARRAPTAERITAGISAVIVIALLVWLVVPGGGSGSTKLASGGGGQGVEQGLTPDANGATAGQSGAQGAVGGTSAAGATAGGGTASGPAKAGAAGGGAGANSAAAGPGCPNPPSGVPGVSASQIKIAVTLTNIVGPAANSIFGIASPADQQKWYEAQIDDINKAGGIACRKIIPTFYPTNPADQNELQQRCLQIVQSGVFAEVDNGAYAIYPQKQCFGQHKVPFFGGYSLYQDEIDGFYPYLFNISDLDTIDHNSVFALRDRGFFNVGAGEKIGFTYRDCDKALVNKWMQWFQQIGVSSKLVTYDFGCPAVFASPSDLQAAVLKFKSNNVTRMTAHQIVGDWSNFTKVAQQQGFHPQYGLPDESLIDVAYGSQAGDPDNIVGAIAIAQGRSGEERTPGAVPTPGTAKCNAAYTAHGIAPVYKLAPGAGYVCDQLWMLQAAINNAPAFRPDALAIGLQQTKSIDFSYPGGPTDFTGVRATTGGQFWRVAQFMASCKCWQVIDPNFHPSYP
ncbi:MAG TPA: hypothetical protein VG076_04625 [Acidimicrobiales bacterium]|jgi:hypothetical protein|nr:hypothetical protein [Acidimicrobiales bacterium]